MHVHLSNSGLWRSGFVSRLHGPLILWHLVLFVVIEEHVAMSLRG